MWPSGKLGFEETGQIKIKKKKKVISYIQPEYYELSQKNCFFSDNIKSTGSVKSKAFAAITKIGILKVWVL